MVAFDHCLRLGQPQTTALFRDFGREQRFGGATQQCRLHPTTAVAADNRNVGPRVGSRNPLTLSKRCIQQAIAHLQTQCTPLRHSLAGILDHLLEHSGKRVQLPAKLPEILGNEDLIGDLLRYPHGTQLADRSLQLRPPNPLGPATAARSNPSAR